MSETLSLKEFLADDGEKKVADLPFEAGLKLLEELVSKVEAGNVPLDKAILSYERGVALIQRLRSVLSGAEQKLKVLQKSASGSTKSSE